MLISYRSRFLFFHNPKAAGKSIRAALEPYAYQPDWPRWRRWLGRIGFSRPYPDLPPKELFHASPATIREELPDTIYSHFFKFAFVRNTWDLLVSTYFFILRDPEHRLHAEVKSMAGFDDYLAFRTRRPTAPQKKFVTGGTDALLVDYVGRFETLADDFRTICERIGIKARLPHANKGSHRDYRSYYSDRTAALVAENFADDIEFFGFAFDQPGDTGDRSTPATRPRLTDRPAQTCRSSLATRE